MGKSEYQRGTKRRSTPEEIDAAIKRAVRALAGTSTKVDRHGVAVHAARYLKGHETAHFLKRHLKEMTPEERLEKYGISEEREKPRASGISLRPKPVRPGTKC